ncbi:dihydroxyacetone kinase subunit DhaL [Mycoplasmopsis edwardii]|uniref:Dihydroxyacetone kinase subunit DhaL n=1 Tax=Mycoplasmopsis edwardii TaxID=53558 RepID=A0ACD4PHY1_9BACT|nr:dihydroxyacetone kinase subunit DhaL [Mycoplasmopsis edwardii]WBP84271.1 dihydroxyacetone kinase subunit DhaL [Mycoplasmopsis edwardii]
MKIDVNKFNSIVNNIYSELKANEDFISGLDQSIGDGDHGYNIVRGFNAVLELNHSSMNLETYFMQIGRTLMAKVGGASGPLYGMSFMKGASAFKGLDEITFDSFKVFVNNFAASLELLGKVQLNEKTMYDIWKPLAIKLETVSEINESTKEEITKYLDELLANTANMVATKGRASYLKDRSKGTMDPGSFTSTIILKNILKGF